MSRPSEWTSVRTLVVALAFVPLTLGACRTDAGPGASATDQAQAPSATGEAPGSVSQPDALATLTAKTGGNPVSAGPGDAPAAAGPEAQQTFEWAKATEDALAGIADVQGLVQSMPPLATFTPAAGGPDVSGKLTYVRAGKFYTADAKGGPGDVMARELPLVWAPPEDPGRAWASEDGKRVAFFGGPDAEMWVMAQNGDDARAVSGANLPTDSFEVVAGDLRSEVRLRPGTDYTLVVSPDADLGMFVLTDDNSRHIRGEARLRIVHAAATLEDTSLVVLQDGQTIAGPVEYGNQSADTRVNVGQIRLALTDDKGKSVATLPEFTAADRELKTVFVYGADELKAAHFDYQAGEPSSGNARVRVFNAGEAPVDVGLGNGLTVASRLEPGMLGDYADVPTVMTVDGRKDAELALYGLRAGEDPVRWSADGSQVAFVGFGDGQADVYVADLKGKVTRVTRDVTREINPRWSPDGRWIVWESIEESADQHAIGLYKLGGTATTLDTNPLANAMGWALSSPIKFPEGVEWADDGIIYFYPQGEGHSAGIWTYDVKSGAFAQTYERRLTDVAFSPERREWAVVSADAPGQVEVVGQDGSRVVAQGDAWAPDWSPDGSMLSWVEGAPTSPDGWRIHVVNADGTGDRVLTDWLPVLQSEPPVPGPKAKREWLSGGRALAFTRAGRDYGAAERAGIGGAKAGDDIENVWIVPTDGSRSPVQATDLTRVFYLRGPEESPGGDTLALVGFSYLDRVQWLWTLPAQGGKPQKIDGGVRWYKWDR